MSPRDHLGEFEQLVLLAVLRLDGDGYGASIRCELEERAGRRPSIGALYATLERLETKGLVVTREGEPRPERGGRARRHYRVTDLGLARLERGRRVLEAMWDGLTLGGAGSEA